MMIFRCFYYFEKNGDQGKCIENSFFYGAAANSVRQVSLLLDLVEGEVLLLPVEHNLQPLVIRQLRGKLHWRPSGIFSINIDNETTGPVVIFNRCRGQNGPFSTFLLEC